MNTHPQLLLTLITTTSLFAGATFGQGTDRRSETAATTAATRMKAIVYHDYGSPDVLQLEEIEKPVPNDNQLLIKVRAVSVNPLDWHYLEGVPYLGRLWPLVFSSHRSLDSAWITRER